ncbi:MAG: site-specific integrase [Candidatus Margulisbacteria bacterium]|nr:site-specific integrase [Candidatus Margulisiibacteriota bacterium]
MAFIKTISGKKGVTYHIDEYINGKRRSKKIPARNMKEAKEFLNSYLWERVNFKTPSLMMKDILFSELAKEYREFSMTRKTVVTLSREQSIIKILNTEIGNMLLKQINSNIVEALQTKWSNHGKANKTINNRTVLLSSILNYAITKEYIPYALKIKPLKTDIIRPKFYTDGELKLILESADEMLGNIIKVLINTGLRTNELRHLKWEDIDFKNKLLRVEKSKSHKFRVVPINNKLLELLNFLRKKKTHKQIYLFEFNEGLPINDYYHKFKRLLKKLNISGDVHQFRHTFATQLVERNANIYEVQHLLGHASVQTTQRYAHVKQDKLFQTVNLLCG